MLAKFRKQPRILHFRQHRALCVSVNGEVCGSLHLRSLSKFRSIVKMGESRGENENEASVIRSANKIQLLSGRCTQRKKHQTVSNSKVKEVVCSTKEINTAQTCCTCFNQTIEPNFSWQNNTLKVEVG